MIPTLQLPDPMSHTSMVGMDQADGLRRLFGMQKGHAVAFVSGREVTDRAALLAKTAIALADMGQSVVLIDEHDGKAGVHAALGAKIKRDLVDVIQGDLSVEECVQPVGPLLSVISAVRCAIEPLQKNTFALQKLDLLFKQLQESAAFILLDCATPPGRHLSPLASMMSHVVVMAGAQGSAITGAYTLIKQLSRAGGRDDFHLAITKTRTEQEAQVIFHNMRQTAQAHLNVAVSYLGSTRALGHMPGDDHLAAALQRGFVHGEARGNAHLSRSFA